MISSLVHNHLAKLKEQGLHRQRRLVSSFEAVNFSSNDYLSLAQNQQIKSAFQKGFANHPSGSGGSMVICGYHASHRILEQAFAEALNVDDALIFNSGYAANLGLISLLAQFNPTIIIDKAAHASFYDGLRLNECNYSRYLHNDLINLKIKLEKRADNPIVITESIFSMSGQAVNLYELAKLCSEYSADCIVDEAHAFGVLGPQGLGAVAQYGLDQNQIPLRIIPFGKAFAFQGAIVAGKGEWIDALLQLARSHRYSTAISPALAYGLMETFSFIRAAEDRRKKLADLINYFQSKQKKSSLNWRQSSTAIQQLQLGCPHKALSYTEYLQSKGIFCQAMREPTVTKKDTGLRVLLNYDHEPEDIDHLFLQLESIKDSHESAY